MLGGGEARRLAATNESWRQVLDAGLRSTLLVPLVWQSRITGVLSFRSKLEDIYTPEVVALAEQVAAQIAGAVAAAGLYAQSKRDVEV